MSMPMDDSEKSAKGSQYCFFFILEETLTVIYQVSARKNSECESNLRLSTKKLSYHHELLSESRYLL